MEKCPACGYIANVITNNHCRSIHGISKKELIQKHGKMREYFVINSKIKQWAERESKISKAPL